VELEDAAHEAHVGAVAPRARAVVVVGGVAER
jgi:hypothetical protein